MGGCPVTRAERERLEKAVTEETADRIADWLESRQDLDHDDRPFARYIAEDIRKGAWKPQ